MAIASELWTVENLAFSTAFEVVAVLGREMDLLWVLKLEASMVVMSVAAKEKYLVAKSAG